MGISHPWARNIGASGLRLVDGLGLDKPLDTSEEPGSGTVGSEVDLNLHTVSAFR